MQFASVRELSQNPSRFIDLRGVVIITKYGKPTRALVDMSEEDLGDLILAERLELAEDARKAAKSLRQGRLRSLADLRKKLKK